MAITPRAAPVQDGAPPTSATDSWSDPALRLIVDEFIARWEHGENPKAEDYLDRLPPGPPDEAIELIYREYCLARSAGLNPDPSAYLARFPALDGALRRLFELHDAFPSRDLQRWAQPEDLPEAGDEIGTYILEREMGRGAFARVYLARQADLDDRLVVVKVSVKITPEHRLLARAGHPHIVEVFAHGTIDDGAFQLIAMPFLGGATLATVLAERRLRAIHPRSGRDLLAILDHVSAPEYSAGNQARPARDLMARLSYLRAAAWIVARLAEALDHAFSRNVAHGDVKPSNVLLTAAGIPILLDFNLAVGWQCTDAGDALEDMGGTLAYMAPERLQAIADPQNSLPPQASDRHRADIYALGIVLLETLTGLAPEPPIARARDQRQIAAAYLDSRRKGALALLHNSRRAIPLALRPILARCLAPDPANRYARASELAEDLDRWRTDRPLKHAKEPFAQYALLRWPRRQWVALTALFLVFAALTAWNHFHQKDLAFQVEFFKKDQAFQAKLSQKDLAFQATSRLREQAIKAQSRQQALENLDRYWDHADAGVFRYLCFLREDRWRAAGQGNLAEYALRHLTFFEVKPRGNWRERAEFRDLPPFWRDELEIWLLDQALRYGQEVAARREVKADWEVALRLLEHLTEQAPLRPLEDQARILRQLGRFEPSNRPPSGNLPPRWMEKYLQGVAAEEGRPEEALAHYQSVLAERPEAFWAHHRASHLNYRLGNFSAAADHLHHCLNLRPKNPALYVQWAGCLYGAGQVQEALQAYDKAESLDPKLAETYSSRRRIRDLTGIPEHRKEDDRRFQQLARRQDTVSPLKLRLEQMLCWELSGGSDDGTKSRALVRKLLAIDPDNIEARKTMVYLLRKNRNSKLLSQALKHVNIIIEHDSDDFWARFYRANIYREMDFEYLDAAKGDIEFLIKNSRFDEFIQDYPPALRTFLYASRIELKGENLEQALEYAEQGLSAAQKYHESEDEAHYTKACVLARAAQDDASLVPQVADQLKKAFDLNPALSERLDKAPAFAQIRDAVRDYLKREPAPGREY